MRKVLGLAVGAAMMVAAPVGAQGIAIGSDLLEKCSPGKVDEAMYTFCLGYIEGTAATFQLLQRASGLQQICPPQGVTIGQISAGIVKFLEGSPAVRHEPATTVVLGALMGAYPCSNAKGAQ